MKRKSILGFVTGLIGAIGSAILAFYIYVVFAIVFGFADAAKSSDLNNENITKILLIIYCLSVILAIIAICFYFSKARVGGFLMLMATIANATFLVYIIKNTSIAFSLIFLFLPTILLFISTLAGLFSKVEKPKQVQAIEKQTNDQHKYCTSCGNKLNLTDEFCSHCGTKQ